MGIFLEVITLTERGTAARGKVLREQRLTLTHNVPLAVLTAILARPFSLPLAATTLDVFPILEGSSLEEEGLGSEEEEVEGG